MIGLDTNVLVRYIAQDDAVQSPLATKYIESFINKDEYLLINHLVICELIWVMNKCYDSSKKNVINVISTILSTDVFKIPHSQIIRQALKDYQKGNADFADYLVGRINKSNECAYTITFDKKASLSDTFELLTQYQDS